MPSRKLPQTNPTRYHALKAVNDRKAVTPVADVPLTAATIIRFDLFFPQYKIKYLAVQSTLTAQSALTNQIKTAKLTAGYFVSDFIDALQNAVRRGTFDASVRGLYGLPVTHPLRPQMDTEQDVLDWGEQVHDGETARIAAGGAPITFPSLADVDAAVNNFKTLNLNQAAAKTAYDNAQEALEEENIEADKLILKVWNEIEAAFDVGNKPSLRRKAREWGVYYLNTPGEVLNPDEFSLTGKVKDSITNLPLDDVLVRVIETNTVVITNAQGNYFVGILPPGSYTVMVIKNGYEVKLFEGVVITAGVITDLDVVLVPGVTVLTGTVNGQVLAGAGTAPATVTVVGTTISVGTDPSGNFTLEDVPEGSQDIRCSLNSNPADFQTQTVTVPPGGTVTVNFNFP